MHDLGSCNGYRNQFFNMISLQIGKIQQNHDGTFK